MIFSLRDMGGMYVDLSKPDSALACYNKALALAEASHDKPMAITVTGQLARFYSQQGDYEMAFKCLNKVIGEDSCWDRGSIAGIAAKWYEANGKPDSAIMLYKEVADIGTVYTKADAYKALAEHYLAQKKQKEAALCLTNYKKAIDSIQGITTTEAIKQTSNLREYRFRESEFRRLRQKNKEQRAIMAILATIGSVATLALAFLSVYLRRKRNLQSMKLGRRKTGKASEPGHEAGNGMKDSLMHSEEIYKSIMLMVNNPNAKKENHRRDVGRTVASGKQDLSRLRRKPVQPVQDEHVRLSHLPAHQDKDTAVAHSRNGQPEHIGGEHPALKAIHEGFRQKKGGPLIGMT